MYILIVLTVLLTVIYGIFILWLIKGYLNFGKNDDKHSVDFQPLLTVVIPFRDEEKNLSNLLNSLDKQDYPHELVEIVLINDYSQDRSVTLVNDWLNNDENRFKRKLINTEEAGGKKQALRKGISIASSDLILQTDADCILPLNWIKESVKPFQNSKTEAALGVVDMLPQQRKSTQFMALEFLSLQASGIALGKRGLPIMSNGANLSYRKSSWEQYHLEEDKWASGDDVFFIQKLALKNKESIAINEKSVVTTLTPASLKEFINQRIRWGSKTVAYPMVEAKYVAYLVALLNVSLIALLFSALWNISGFWWFLILVGIKAIPDLILLRSFAKRKSQKRLLQYFVTTALFYPLYIVLSGILIITASSVIQWKGRSLKVN